ncbi:MCE family protein [Nocardia higoensis]|uniref:MCE family protein n=1 Tax=Nocardia higoensis TaxID=228599 RepID=UPI000304E324|nr:MCE family protein [Nocardia higoensis]
MTSKIYSSKRLIGLVTVAGIVLISAAVLAVGSAGIGRTRYEAEFAQAAGIRAGDGITIAGVPVGTVSGTELAGDRVVVAMAIDEGIALGAQTTASIELTTLLGARYIELTPAGSGEIPGHRIPLERTTVPYDLQQTLADATVTFENIDTAQLGRSLIELSEQLAGVPSVLPEVLADVQTLASIVGGRRDELGSLLTSSRELTSVVRAQQDGIGAVMTQGRDLLEQIVARRAAIQQLLIDTTELVDQLHTIVVDDRPQLETMLAGLDGLLASLGRHDDLLRNILEIMPVPVRNFTNVTGTANEIDFTAPAGVLMDSWMCALSGRAREAALPPYLQDCE